MYKGIIFDFNGTLFFDSEKHLKAWKEFSKHVRKYEFTDEEMRDFMFGRTNKDILAYLLKREPEQELVEELTREKEALYRQMCKRDMKNTILAKGAIELLDYLVKNNIPHTIATMSEKTNVDFFIEIFNLKKWFDLDKIVYDDGTIPGKPAPDIYLKAAKNIGLKPEECIVVEDAMSGLESAYRAKIGKIIAIASMESDELYKKIPYVSEIIHDFQNFNLNIFEIPIKINS